MTGGSLGLRSGSYGSLQQIQHHHQQQLLQQQQILYGNGVSITSVNSALLPTNSPPVGAVVRKVSKMSVVGAKERRWPWICKFASRRKVGMLLLLIASVAVVLSFFFAITKDEDQPTGPETVIGNSDHVWRFVGPRKISSNYLSPPPIPVTDKVNTPTLFDEKVSVVNNETEDKENTSNYPPPPPPLPVPPPPPPFLPSVTIPAHHPCENYSLPPPPMDPKRTGPRPCDVCYVPVDLAMAYMPALPSETPILQNLNYLSEENLLANESNGGSIFGGHPSLQQRDESYDIKESMTVHCGFVKGKKPGLGTGFDIDEADMLEMEQCHGVVVASAIFGNYDVLQQPRQISEDSKRTACFYMFVDEETEAFIKNSTTLDSSKRAGLWRLVVVRNLPYEDARRNGKVPKLLLHRLFPNARFSLWIDGKLELVVDPYQILERFLWRNNASFAISKHYRRFDVFVEAEANKAAGKYDNASIDNQIEFYKREGLTHFSPAKYPILSDVPEGCVIIREHTPITNLFTCLWFNEVDRFTSRDQLSFSTVRDKITSKVNWFINMFQDCERRNFVVQAYHRDVLEQRLASVHQNPSPDSARKTPRKTTPDVVADVATTRSDPSKKLPARRGNRKSGSKKRRSKGVDTARDPNPV